MSEPEQPQIYLVTPPDFDLGSFPDRLAAVLDAHDIACLRLSLATRDEDRILRAADACREVAHRFDVALVIDTHVVLAKRLEAALRRLNPWISDENLRKVLRGFTHPNFAGLVEYNKAIWEMLCGTGDNAIAVEQDLGAGRKGQTVTLVDFDNPANNDFLCTSQFKVEGPTRCGTGCTSCVSGERLQHWSFHP